MGGPGENNLRFASSLAAALMAFLNSPRMIQKGVFMFN